LRGIGRSIGPQTYIMDLIQLDGASMANIDIKETIFKDPRFMKLTIELQDHEKAIGSLVYAWMTSFEFWKNGRKNIPKKVWEERGLNNAIIKTGLARIIDKDFISVCGTEKHHDWIHGRIAAGRNGGLKSLGKKTSKTKQNEANASPFPVPVPVPIPNPRPTPNFPTEYKNDFCPKFISIFCAAWKDKYNAQYKFMPKEIGLLKSQFKETSEEKFGELIGAYLKMHKSNFIQKRHSFTEFYYCVNEVNHFMQTGVKVSRHDANQIELQEHNKNIFTNAAKERAINDSK